MTSRKIYAYTEGAVSTVQTQDLFTYRTDGWKDQLLSWNGKSYAYDAGGNPTVLRGMALTWGEGRRLKRIAATAGEVTFAYDSDGKRVRKTSGGNITTYYYNGNVLSGLVRKASKDAGTTGMGTTVQFVYDTQGKPFMLRLNGKTDYFYLYNGLGDITGLVDSSNQVVVRYQYNSWGKVTSTQDTSGVSLATLNPFRYRKYVYDPETGLYCLGSRYYDPEVGRFVNADDTDVIFAKPQELYHKNLYVYCDNNPVVREDQGGNLWGLLATMAVGAVIGMAIQYANDVVTNIAEGKTGADVFAFRSTRVDYVAAAVSGALAATAVGKVGQAIGNAAISGISYALNQENSGKRINPVDTVVNVGIGAVCGLVGGDGANGTRLYGVNKRATQVMATTHSAKKMAQYAAKKAAVRRAFYISVARTVASSGTGSLGRWGYQKFKRALVE